MRLRGNPVVVFKIYFFLTQSDNEGPPVTNKKLIFTCSAVLVFFLVSCAPNDVDTTMAVSPAEEGLERTNNRAVLVPGSGTYSRTISTDSSEAQQYFDQGLRFAWGFYFPESIASYQQAALFDPASPMPYWGMAHAMGPNPKRAYWPSDGY